MGTFLVPNALLSNFNSFAKSVEMLLLVVSKSFFGMIHRSGWKDMTLPFIERQTIILLK